MTVSFLIKGGTVLNPGDASQVTADVRVTEGDITEVGRDLRPEPDETTVDASGLWVTPGLIDIHTHLRDFGQSDKEDIETGTAAAAAGGYTTVVAMANTEPPMDSAAVMSLLLKKIADRAHIEVLPVATVTMGMQGTELTAMFDLAAMGAIAFSDDGMPVANLAILRRALEYAQLADRVIISHAEDRDLAAGGAMHDCAVATSLGIPGIPAAAEAAAIASEIEVVRQTGGRLHFAHVSLAASVELIRAGKRDGLPLTADVTPHHLTLAVDDIKGYDPAYKMNPPLRTKADQEALVAALEDGTIDAIATDHAPHTRLEKSRPFDQAPFGIIGLETAFPLTVERLIATGRLEPLALIALFTVRPAGIFGLPQPSVKAGNQANLAVFDPNHKWVYDATKGRSKSANSPYHGRRLTGRAVLTIAQGRLAYKDGELFGARATAAPVSR